MFALLLIVLSFVLLVMFNYQNKQIEKTSKKTQDLLFKIALVCLGFAIGMVGYVVLPW